MGQVSLRAPTKWLLVAKELLPGSHIKITSQWVLSYYMRHLDLDR